MTTDGSTRPVVRGDVEWLLRTTTLMVRCRRLDELLDVAYDAVHTELGYDRVGVNLVDSERSMLVDALSTDEFGRKYRPLRRETPLGNGSYYARVLADPDLGLDGPGFMLLEHPAQVMPPEDRAYLDGDPRQMLRISLRTPDRVLGWFSVDNLISARPVSTDQAAPLVAFGNVLALALEHVTLLEARERHIDALDADRLQAQEQLRLLSRAVEQSPVSVMITDPTGAIEYVNPQFCAVSGYSIDEALGQNPWILQSGLTPLATYEGLWSTLLAGGTWQGIFTNRKKNGEVFWEQASISPMYNEHGRLTHYVAVKEDITERRRTEAALARANRALAAITAGNEALVRATTEMELLAQVCRAIVDAGAYPLAWVGFKRDDAERSVQPMAWAGSAAEYVQQISISWADVPTGRGPAGRSIRTGCTHVMKYLLGEPDYQPWWHAAQGQGFASSIAIPLQVEGAVIGLLSIYAPETDAFDREEQRLLERLADDLAYGIAALRVRAERELVTTKLHTSEARLRAIVEQAAVGIVMADPAGICLLVNPRLCTLLGYGATELQGHHVGSFLHPEEQERDEPVLQQLNTGTLLSAEGEARLLRHDGQVVWTHLSSVTLRDSAGTLQGTVTIVQDISDRRRAETALQQAAADNALLAAAVENTSVGVVVSDATGADIPIVYANPAFLRITGYAEHEVLGRDPRFVQGESTSPMTRQAQQDALDSGRGYADTHLVYRKDGTPIWCEVRITPITDAHGVRTNFVGLVTDVSEQVTMREELERLALHDQLTGLPNRALLQDRTTQAILQATRQQQHAALLLLDLDHFREVNDAFGHQVGDRLLQCVAEILQGALRTTDTVARLGGDEFAVLLPSTNAQGAVATATTLQRVLSEPLVLLHQTLRPDASIGIALYPEHGTDATALLQHAEVAMYSAKRARRTSMVYEPNEDMHTLDRAVLREELRQAIDRKQFRLHYQPLVQVASGAVTAVEALLRWDHPKRGLVFPDTILPLIEAAGLQEQVTRWVLEESVRQQREWRTRGLDLAVQINLAASDLHDEQVIADVATLLLAPEPPVRLCLELTEGALMGDLSHTRAVLLRLAAAGAQIAIDDYGTGYSSLSRLARLPVDQLKIDRLFVQSMTVNPVDASIVASTVGLAHSVGVPVVAEGVEDEATLTQLRGLGCDMVQGYFFSRPLPPAELERWLHARTLSRDGQAPEKDVQTLE